MLRNADVSVACCAALFWLLLCARVSALTLPIDPVEDFHRARVGAVYGGAGRHQDCHDRQGLGGRCCCVCVRAVCSSVLPTLRIVLLFFKASGFLGGFLWEVLFTGCRFGVHGWWCPVAFNVKHLRCALGV